jgi:hypothetical protein
MRSNLRRTAVRLSLIAFALTFSLSGVLAEGGEAAPATESGANPLSAIIGLLASFLIAWLKKIEWVNNNPRIVALIIAVSTTVLQHYAGVMPDSEWITWLLTLLLTISGQEIGWNLLLKPGARKMGFIADKKNPHRS